MLFTDKSLIRHAIATVQPALTAAFHYALYSVSGGCGLGRALAYSELEYGSGQTHLDYTLSLDGTFKYLAKIVHVPAGPEPLGLDAPSL